MCEEVQERVSLQSSELACAAGSFPASDVLAYWAALPFQKACLIFVLPSVVL